MIAAAHRRAPAGADAALPAQRRPAPRSGPWRVAALGGTFAPSWYNTPAAALPPSRGRKATAASLKLGKSRDDKRRHFVRDEVAARARRLTDIDVFLTHEAPRPFYPAGRRHRRRQDRASTRCSRRCSPRLHLFGHHHEFTDSVRQGVRSIGLDVVTQVVPADRRRDAQDERLDTDADELDLVIESTGIASHSIHRCEPFLDALDDRVLVCDGAMGTMLYAKGVFINKSFDALNLTQPDLVAEVHQEYVRAGADVIETNTFGANRIKLGSFGLADRLHAINAQGARIARHAAREQAYVAGAIGPLGIRIEPWGKTGVDEARELLPRAGAGARRRRRRSVHPRDVPRSERDRRGDRRRAQRVATCRSSRR